MELFRNNKLLVTLSDSGELTVSEKSGVLCSKKETVETCNIADIIEMIPDKGGSCVALAALNTEFYLKMNNQAVQTLLDRWNAIPKSFTKELMFEKKNVRCTATSNGILLFVEKPKKSFLSCSKQISVFCILMEDVVLADSHKKMFKGDTFFMCTEDHAIEIRNLDTDVIERLTKELKTHGTHLLQMKSYERAFRFSLSRETEHIYVTSKGMAHYYKKNWKKSEFCFAPWDSVQFVAKSKGCLKKKLMLVAENPIITTCKFSAGDVSDIVDYVNKNIQENAGDGTMYGRGANKVYVTDTHLLLMGKEFRALKKPYDEGQFIKRSFCSSYVDIDGMKVKVGRYEWKACCCGTGSFYSAVTASPTRELKTDANKHTF